MSIKYTYLQKPGLHWSDLEITQHVKEYQRLAITCLNEIPEYQCLIDSRKNFERLVILEARDRASNEILGLCSSLILDIPTKPNALHLGLTLVSPKARGLGLTHKLTSKLLMNYMLRNSMFSSIWVTNVACVISSLGNVATHFENVFPSPNYHKNPTKDHLEIAQVIDKNYREDIYIAKNAEFDPTTFLFKESVLGTMWQKSASDKQYHHRKKELTEFYANYLNFERGDELLQVGHFSLATFPKYLIKKMMKKLKNTNGRKKEHITA